MSRTKSPCKREKNSVPQCAGINITSWTEASLQTVGPMLINSVWVWNTNTTVIKFLTERLFYIHQPMAGHICEDVKKTQAISLKTCSTVLYIYINGKCLKLKMRNFLLPRVFSSICCYWHAAAAVQLKCICSCQKNLRTWLHPALSCEHSYSASLWRSETEPRPITP